jgi:hypothetical protein
MLALYEQGLEFKPIHRTYIFEKMDGVSSTYTKRLLVHMYPSRVLIEMLHSILYRVPKQFAPKLLKAIYGKSLIPTKAHIETLRLNVRYQDDKRNAKTAFMHYCDPGSLGSPDKSTGPVLENSVQTIGICRSCGNSVEENCCQARPADL